MADNDATNSNDNEGGDDKPTLTTQLALSAEDFEAVAEADRLITIEQHAEFNTAATAREGTAVSTYREGERERSAKAQRDRDDEARARAGEDEDIRWATRLDSEEASTDEDTAKAARETKAADRERYDRAVAARVGKTDREQSRRVMGAHYEPLLVGLQTEGHKEFVENFNAAVTAAGGNTLLAALNEGKRIGLAEGIAQGKDAADRDNRIQRGKDGAPEGSNGTGGGGRGADDYDFKKPGEARRMATDAIRESLKITS